MSSNVATSTGICKYSGRTFCWQCGAQQKLACCVARASHWCGLVWKHDLLFSTQALQQWWHSVQNLPNPSTTHIMPLHALSLLEGRNIQGPCWPIHQSKFLYFSTNHTSNIPQVCLSIPWSCTFEEIALSLIPTMMFPDRSFHYTPSIKTLRMLWLPRLAVWNSNFVSIEAATKSHPQEATTVTTTRLRHLLCYQRMLSPSPFILLNPRQWFIASLSQKLLSSKRGSLQRRTCRRPDWVSSSEWKRTMTCVQKSQFMERFGMERSHTRQ